MQDLISSNWQAPRPLYFASKNFCSSPSICISPESSESGSKLSCPARLQSSMLNSAGIISSSQNSSLFPHDGEMARSSAGMCLPTLATSPTAVTDVFYSIADFMFGSIINTINKYLHRINTSIHHNDDRSSCSSWPGGHQRKVIRHLPNPCHQSVPRAELSMASTDTQEMWSFALEIS